MSPSARWFEAGGWPIWTFDTSASEWRRLEEAAAKAGLQITPVAVAAQIIADRTGIDLREAWDRLAFNLERMQAGRWPPDGPAWPLVNDSLTTMERIRC